MKTPQTLSEEDLRSVIRLLSRTGELQGSVEEKKEALMQGLCSLLDADRWAWGLSRQMEPGKPNVHISLLHGGFTQETYPVFTQAYSHPAMTGVQASFAAELVERKCHLTRLRQQIDPTESFLKTEAGPLWEKADINGVIMSLRPMSAGYFTIVGIYRRFSAPIFDERSNHIAHVVLSNVPDLHEHGLPEEHVSTLLHLKPRERMTLDLLVQGYSREDIARHLEISLHTANDYVKSVFSHYSVHSQASLIARFRSGDGGHS